MTIDDKTLERVQEMAGLFLSIKEIAAMLDLCPDSLACQLAQEDSPLQKAYFKGRTRSKYLIRKKVVDLARMGSPQAELLVEKYIEEQELSDNE